MSYFVKSKLRKSFRTSHFDFGNQAGGKSQEGKRAGL